MARDRQFERTYSINVSRLGPGAHQDEFDIDAAFFSHFEQSPIEEAQVKVVIEMYRYGTHIDAKFILQGHVVVNCDRCGEPYPQSVDDARYRLIFSFNENMDFDGEEVLYVDRDESQLVLTQEFYDFINLALPIRRVPEPEVHACDPAILALIRTELPEPGTESDAETEEDEGPIDPRWAALKNLKDRLN